MKTDRDYTRYGKRKTGAWFKKQNHALFNQECALLSASEAIAEKMDARGIGQGKSGRRALAERLRWKVSPAWVKALLDHSTNPTVRELSDVACALGCKIEFRMVKDDKWKQR